jgi:enamine deaminase RidA (YjgF/YER057c/UK114 family)
MNKSHVVDSVALSAAKFAHAVKVPPGARLLNTIRLTGVALNGKLRQGCEAQAMQAWKNLLALLRNADMGLEDIVQMTTCCGSAADNPIARRIRNDLYTGV